MIQPKSHQPARLVSDRALGVMFWPLSLWVGLASLVVPARSWADTPATNVVVGFVIQQRSDRLILTHNGQPVADFVYRDAKIKRPYFTNVHAPNGTLVTRRHPPVPGQEDVDHDTMHPGIWLGFGDISGTDFWRNQGTMEHLRFNPPPVVERDQVRFTTECQLRTSKGETLCQLQNRFIVAARPVGFLFVWDATLRSRNQGITLGDQEEMGFGIRVTKRLIEKQGGELRNSRGVTTAAKTWGQPADWCDYSGTLGNQKLGITIMPAPGQFRPSWWHTRDYGLMVANPFGREAMKQGPKSSIAIAPSEDFRLRFGAMVHSAPDYSPETAYKDFLALLPILP